MSGRTPAVDVAAADMVCLGRMNTWLEINTNALQANASLLVSHLNSSGGSPTELMAVVKADGYGHGAATAAKAFREGGATWFGVTSTTEAEELIVGGIDSTITPVVVFAPAATLSQARCGLVLRAHLTVCDRAGVELVERAAVAENLTASIHLKVDTGMSRLGLAPPEALAVARCINSSPSLHFAGVYTHFATASEHALGKTKAQFDRFQALCDVLNSEGITGFKRHCANSAAALRIADARLDLARVGTVLYGQMPSAFVPKIEGLRTDTWTLKSRVVFVHDLPAGVEVGYGAEYTTKRPTKAAVIALGYADGVSMQPASVTRGARGLQSIVSQFLAPRPLTVTFGALRAPVIGRIAMQMMVVDITDCTEPVAPGWVATVPARRLAVSSRIPKITVDR